MVIPPELGLAHNVWPPGKATRTELDLKHICRMMNEWILVLAPVLLGP